MEILLMVIHTLNDIEIHGKDNLSKLLGCIQALEELTKADNQGESEEKADG